AGLQFHRIYYSAEDFGFAISQDLLQCSGFRVCNFTGYLCFSFSDGKEKSVVSRRTS
ncbi:hypothetical protein KI387_032626, partial [Taxus chinensis]